MADGQGADDASFRRLDQVREYKRAMIRDAAKEVFADRGIDAASMRQIAQVAGYTTGAIYTYFATKEELYAEVLRDSLTVLLEQVTAAAERASSNSSIAALEALWRFYDERPADFDLGFYLYNGAKPMGLTRELNTELNERLDASVRVIARQLVAERLCREQDSHRMATAYATSVFGVILLSKTGRLGSLGGHAPQEILDSYFASLVVDTKTSRASTSRASTRGKVS